MAGPSLHKELMTLYEQKQCQFELKRTDGTNWRKAVGLLEFDRTVQSYLTANMCSSSRGRNDPKAIQRPSELLSQFQQSQKASARGLGARTPGRALVAGPPPRAVGVMLRLLWAWKYCQALRSNKICLVKFWTCLGPISPFFLLISPF